jgi:CHAD domain-containing protein
MKNKFSKKYVTEYHERHVNRFLADMEKTRKKPDEENIHQLRLDIKRIRNFLVMLEWIYPEKIRRKKQGSVLDPVFDSGGKIRELQVNLLYLSGRRLPLRLKKKYEDYINHERELLQRKLIKAVDHFDYSWEKRSREKITKLCRACSQHKLNAGSHALIRSKAKSVEVLSGSDRKTAMHKTRTHLKTIYGVISFLLKEGGSDGSEKLRSLLGPIKTAADLIGEWHDQLALIHSLNKFRRVAADKREAVALNRLISQLKKENKYTRAISGRKTVEINRLIRASHFNCSARY